MIERDCLDLSSKMLNDRGALLSLWQEIADHFYPERAAFTYTRYLGEEFADHLITSTPVLIRRELGDSLSAMLRRRGEEWFHIITLDKTTNQQYQPKRWLEWATTRQHRIMYDRETNFVRATKEGDHDFATFGQNVISIEPNRDMTGIVYTTMHLRDCAWRENNESKIDTFTRKRLMSAADIMKEFPKTSHRKIVEAANSDKKKHDAKYNLRHLLMPSEDFNDKQFSRFKYVSAWIDEENKHFVELIGMNRRQYAISRWQTVSGSQYAFSPASIVALPDARLIQAMALTLLEAGENYTRPPLIATQDAVRSTIEAFAGGVTWIDREYDERLGDALRPMTQDKSGFPYGLDMNQAVATNILKAFYVDKLGPLPVEKEMTAFEVGQLVQDWIRSALPLFEPMEVDYNGQICENTFELAMSMGLMGSAFDMPSELRNMDYEFRFESPLHDHMERVKTQQFMEVKQMLKEAVEADPDAIAEIDIRKMFRDAVQATGAPTEWLRDPEMVDEIISGIEQQRQSQQMLDHSQQAMETVKTGAEAGNMIGRV